MDLKSPESEKKTTKATSNGGDSDIEMLDDDGNTAPPSSNKVEKKGNKKAVSDVIDLSSDEAQEPEEEEEEEESEGMLARKNFSVFYFIKVQLMLCSSTRSVTKLSFQRSTRSSVVLVRSLCSLFGSKSDQSVRGI